MCGYNLVTLPTGRACPECGTPVLASIGPHLLQFARHSELHALDRGLLWSALAATAPIIIAIVQLVEQQKVLASSGRLLYTVVPILPLVPVCRYFRTAYLDYARHIQLACREPAARAATGSSRCHLELSGWITLSALLATFMLSGKWTAVLIALYAYPILVVTRHIGLIARRVPSRRLEQVAKVIVAMCLLSAACWISSLLLVEVPTPPFAVVLSESKALVRQGGSTSWRSSHQYALIDSDNNATLVSDLPSGIPVVPQSTSVSRIVGAYLAVGACGAGILALLGWSAVAIATRRCVRTARRWSREL